MRNSRRLLALFFVLVPVIVCADDAPTPAALVSAPRVSSAVRVTTVNNKKVMYARDNEQGVGSELNGVVLTTSGKISVIVRDPNPLKQQISASAAAVDDPSAAVFAKLLDAISGIAAILQPPTAAGTGVFTLADPGEETFTCKAVDDAEQQVKSLSELVLSDGLASPKKLNEAIEAWSDKVANNDKKGRAAIEAAALLIKTHADSLQKNIDNAEKMIDLIRARADRNLASVQAELQLARDGATKAIEKLEDFKKLLGPKHSPAEEDVLGKLEKALEDANGAVVSKGADFDCERQARSVYRAARVALPFAELARLKNLTASIKALRSAIDTAYLSQDVRARWINDDRDFELVWDVKPTAEKGQRVTVKWVPLSVSLVDDALQTKQGDAISATFDVYLFRRWVPEFGLGLTYGVVERPKYGTGTKDGKTVVQKLDDEELHVEPTVMVNFLPWGEAGLTPMIQLGAAVSKDAPALLMGGGWRIFGTKGGAAIGLGLMLTWIKDLQGLKVDDPVDGTKDIEDHLAFGGAAPKPRFYVNVQYKF